MTPRSISRAGSEPSISRKVRRLIFHPEAVRTRSHRLVTTLDVIAARAAMIGNLDRLAGFFWGQNLQIGNDYGVIAVNRDVWQGGEMRQPSGNGGLMVGALQIGADRFVADRAREIGAAVKYRIRGKNRLGIGRVAGIGAGRVAGDQIVDFEPILDGAETPFERQFFVFHDQFLQL